jgi:hypothetical protein
MANLTTEKPLLIQGQEFGPMLGGPLFKLLQRFGLSGEHLEFVRKRIIVSILLTWVPLLILSLIGGSNRDVDVPFFYDIEVHVRFLVVLPLFIYAEPTVHSFVKDIVLIFTERGLLDEEELPKFNKAVSWSLKFRDSIWPEIILLGIVIGAGFWTWRKLGLSDVALWHSTHDASGTHFSLAGYWYAFVSIPLFQFMYLRWGLRYINYLHFLWSTSRLKLRIVCTHPDRAGGLGFLGSTVYAGSYLLFAQGALLAGMIANRIFFGGQTLLDFKVEVGVFAIFSVLILLLPLTMFTPKLYQAKRKDRRRYGRLGSRYVHEFDDKWIKGKAPEGEPLVGSSDIQSLADLYNSYAVVREMRLVPFGLDAVTQLILFLIAPLLPLLLTIMPMEKIVEWVFKALF